MSFSVRSQEVAFGGCDVKDVEVIAPETAIGGALGGDVVSLQHLTQGGEDVNRWARPAEFPAGGGDEVALGVQSHAINATMFSKIVVRVNLILKHPVLPVLVVTLNEKKTLCSPSDIM